MDDKQREKLNEMIKEFKSEETTKDIRKERNSVKIHKDVQTIINLKRKYARLRRTNPDQFKTMASNKCNFLFFKFNKLFNKLIKDELDLNILFQMIQVLEKIENGSIDQHEGSYMIGGILKKLYVDSALKKESKENSRKNKKVAKKPFTNKKISWNDFKKTSAYENNNLN